MFILPPRYWKVKETSAKGRGVFAQNDIKAGSVIGDYLGKIIAPDDETSDGKEGHYWFWLNEKTSVLAYPGHIGVHLINHSCTPNCDVDYYQGHALYFATRKIFEGEELTVDYLLEPPSKGEKCYHSCECKSPLCRGTFHIGRDQIAKWEKFVERRQGEYYDKPLGKIGSDLPFLSKYPSIIPDDAVHNLWGCEKEPPLILNESITIDKIREILRESGRQIILADSNIKILGIINEMMISKDVK